MATGTTTSAVALTEEMLVPTQLVVFDISSDSISTTKSKSTNASTQSTESIQSILQRVLVDEDNDNVIDFIRLKKEELLFFESTTENNNSSFSSKFCEHLRPMMILELSKLIDKRQLQQPNKGRLVILLFGDSQTQESLFMLSQLPIDIGNFMFWKQSSVPTVFRILVNSGPSSSRVSESTLSLFYDSLVNQYFGSKIPSFGDSTTQAYLTKSCVFANEFDSLCIFNSNQLVMKFLDKLSEMHQDETLYARDHLNFARGSGAKLLVSNEQYIWSAGDGSQSEGWRRIDWFCTSQTKFFKRRWQLSNESDLKEFIDCLDYKLLQRSKFTTGIPFDLHLKKAMLRMREKNWKDFEKRSSSSFIDSDDDEEEDSDKEKESKMETDKQQSIFSTNSFERSPFRVTPGDSISLLQLVKFRYRRQQNQQCLELIESFKQGDFQKQLKSTFELEAFAELEKYEGLCHLDFVSKAKKSNSMEIDAKKHSEKAVQCFREYRKHLEMQLQTTLQVVSSASFDFKSNLDVFNQLFAQTQHEKKLVNIYQELAFCFVKEKSYQQTIENCLKAIELDPLSTTAQKLLATASEASGITTQKQEEIIFSYLVKTVRKKESVEQYYQSCVSKWPSVVWYHFFYANFLVTNAFMVSDTIQQSVFEKCKQLYQNALKIEPNSPAIVGAFATFLANCITSNKETLDEEKRLEIEQLYSNALKIDPLNLLNTANYSAFLLAHSPSQKTTAFQLLDKVLFSDEFLTTEPDLACEGWLLALLYWPENRRLECLQNLKYLVTIGSNSRGFSYRDHLRSAVRAGKKDVNWLNKVCRVVSGLEPNSVLFEWDEWRSVRVEKLSPLAHMASVTQTQTQPLSLSQKSLSGSFSQKEENENIAISSTTNTPNTNSLKKSKSGSTTVTYSSRKKMKTSYSSEISPKNNNNGNNETAPNNTVTTTTTTTTTSTPNSQRSLKFEEQ